MARSLIIGPGKRWVHWCNHAYTYKERDGIDIVDKDSIDVTSNIAFSGDNRPTDIRLYAESIRDYSERPVPEGTYDYIVAERVLEHLDYMAVMYTLFGLYGMSAPRAELEIVVPDFEKVFDSLRRLNPFDDQADKFQRDFVRVDTEIFNDEEDPHQSAWTPLLARYYIECEGLWTVEDMEHITIEGRDWYLKILAIRK